MKAIEQRRICLGADSSAELIEYPSETRIVAASAAKICTWRFRTKAQAEAWAAYYASHQLMPYAFPAGVPRPFDADVLFL
jgi:hypothetical protein